MRKIKTKYLKVFLIILAVGFVFGGVNFFASAEETQKPNVETREATLIIKTAASLNGRIVSDNDSDIVERRFDWGKTSSDAGWDNWITDDPNSDHYGYFGVSGDYFSYYVSDLEPNTTYYFRAWAKNSAGWSSGDILSFTTSQIEQVPNVPSKTSATALSSINIAFIWQDNSNNETGFRIERKISAGGSYSFLKDVSSISGIGQGGYYEDKNLTPDTYYCYRIKALSDGGNSSFSSESCATTLSAAIVLPAVATKQASSIDTNSAILNGTINPNGEISGGFFQWGATVSYGNLTPTITVGDGASPVPVSKSITGLQPNTTYHFRLVGTNANSGSTVFGEDKNFITLSAPSCSDGIKNQDETDVDCGGVCPACPTSPSLGGSSTTRVIYVPDDYPTIQEAVDMANPYPDRTDIIIVRDGIYTENINVNKAHLTIKSENGAEKTIVQAANLDDDVFKIATNYVEVNGFTVKVGSSGINIGSGDYNNIIDNKIINNKTGILGKGRGCEDLHYSYSCEGHDYPANNQIVNNSISNNDSGISINYGRNNIIKHNHISNNFQEGVWIAGSNNRIENNNVQFSNGEYPNGQGIVIGIGGKNNVLIKNTVDSNKTGIKLRYTDNNILRENSVTNNGRFGIHLTDSSNNIIENNFVFNNGKGIFLMDSNDLSGGSNRNVIMHNDVSNNIYSGISISDSNNNVLKSNNISNTVSDTEGYGIYLTRSKNSKVEKNIISNNHCGIRISGNDNYINHIYLNSFVENTNNFFHVGLGWIGKTGSFYNSPEPITYTYNDNTHTNYLGNYWDDYTDIDADNNGIWDNPYTMNSDQDNYPLIMPFENYEEGEIPPNDKYYVNAHSVHFPSADYFVELMVNDPDQNIQSVSVAGPGIDDSISLKQGIHSLHPNQ